MNRVELRALAQSRVGDARILLDNGRWAAAYYLIGYAVECGLKASILAFVERTGAIFRDRKFSDKCWTHDFEELAKQADLIPEIAAASAAGSPLAGYWGTASRWAETSRYEQKTEAEARQLYEAVTHDPDGVLRWLQTHW